MTVLTSDVLLPIYFASKYYININIIQRIYTFLQPHKYGMFNNFNVFHNELK